MRSLPASVALLSTLVVLSTAQSYCITNEGNEFVLLVPPVNSQVQDQFTPQLLVTTSEDMNVSFSVSYGSRTHRVPPFTGTFTASKGSVTKVNLPTGLRAFTNSPVNFDIAVNVKAEGNKTIVVYLLNEDAASTDIALLYPKFATKTNTYIYYAVSSPSASESLAVGGSSFVGIVATEANCVVEITPTAMARVLISRRQPFVHNPGVLVRSPPLPKDTVIFMSSEDDLTGTKVNGTCYLSVITGHQCAFYPADVQSCDGIMEQIPPTETWGFNFFLSPLAKRQSAGYRFIAGADNTVVTRMCNGSEPDTFTLTQAGNFREVLINMPTYCHVVSNQPLLVAQYSLGHEFGGINDIFADPFVTLIAPVGQFNNKYNFILVDSVTPQNVAQPVVFDPYLNLVVTNDCCRRNEILYDGQPLPSSVSFTDIACTGGDVCGCAAQFHPSVSTGAHTLMHTRDSCGIGATLYAWQNQNSYGSLAGTRLDSIAVLVRFNSTIYTVTEGMDPKVTITVLASGAVDESSFSVRVIAKDGTATNGQDYTGGNYSVIFPAGSTKENFSIPITDDDIFETDETFFLTLVIPQPTQDIGVMRGVPFMATVTIMNDEPTVTIDIERKVIDVIENQKFVEVCLVMSGPSSRPVMALVNTEGLTGNVGSSVSIGATSQVDFEVDDPMIALAPSETRSCVNVTIIDDKLVERTEPFEVIITFPPGQPALQIGEIVPPGMQIYGTINIIDDDAVITVQFEQDMYMVDESDGMVDVTVIASGRTSFEYTFTVTPMDLTATNNFDYLYSTTTYSFGPTDDNEPIPSLVISIPIINDGDKEFDENFKLTLEVSADGEAANVTEGPISMTVVLIKDDDNVTVTFNPQNYTVIEGDPAPLMIILDKPAAMDITVTVTTMDITATDNDDYIGGSFDVSIPAGSVKVTLNVSTLQDNIVELPEYFKATLSLPGAPKGCVVGTPDMSYITIIDNTTMIPVWFNPANYSVKEGVDGNAVITLEAGGHTFDFTVIVNSRDGTAFNGSDYIGGRFEVTFPAGLNMVSFNVPILDDAIAECAKLFNLDLDIPAAAAGMGVIRGSPDTATVHIMDDDVVTVSCSPQNYTVSEGIPATLGMVLDKEASESITVLVTTVDITAGSADYVLEKRTPVKFTPGTQRAALPLLTLRDTVINEPNESLKVTLDLEPTTVRVEIGPDPCFVTITDATVGVNFHSAMYMVGEGDGSVTVTVDASKEHPYFDFVIKMVARDGTAETASDLHEQEVNVTFPAGKTTVEASIGINDDEVAESLEIFHLVLEVPEKDAGNGVVAIAPNTTEIKIIDNDDVTVTFSPQNYTVIEGDPAPLMITLDKPATKDITVTVTTMDITAEDTDDYVDGSFVVSIPAGSVKVTLNVSTLRDCIVEPAEYFKATLSLPGAPERCVVGTPDMSYITILDDTHYPQCSFRLCKRRRNALCTLPNATGNCTCNMTSCTAAYYSMDERQRPSPPRCTRRNMCAGLTGEPLEKCLKKWASCVKKAFKTQHGKTPDNLRKNAFFKALEYPCGG